MFRYASLFAALLCLAACAPEEVVTETPLRPVRFEAVESTGGAQVRDFSGTARAGEESRLSFRVPGTLEELAVSVGDEVSSGAIIARLDTGDYELQVQQAQANASQARAQARNADANYQRIRQLYENQGASRSDLENARAQRDSANASSYAAQQQVNLARSQVEYCTLEAPTDGIVADVGVERNENVNAGQLVVLLASNNTDVQPEVEVGVPEIVIGNVTQGDEVEIRFDAVDGQIYAGVVTEVGVQPGQFASTFPVTIRLTNPDAAVRPGMAAQVSFTLGDDEEMRMWVPPHAVGQDGTPFVFVLERNGETGVVRQRPVEIGVIDGRGLEVTSGLEEGELLVTAGLPFLVDGMEVRAPEADRAAEGATAAEGAAEAAAGGENAGSGEGQ